MSKPVNKLQFWKDRIETATKEHYSVYVIHDYGWKVILEEHLKIINKHIPKTSKVLDAGCGYGRMSPYFPSYVGVDFSPDFIQRAQDKYPGTMFVQADLKKLPFLDKEFDWAFCISIKAMIESNLGEEEWFNMATELKRVSKHVLLLEYEEPTKYEII